MYVDRSQALIVAHGELVKEYGDSLTTPRGRQVVLVDGNVTEYTTGWLVPFNTKDFIDTGDATYALIPSAVFVPKDPAIPPHYPPSAFDIPEYLAMIESGEMKWPLSP